MHRLGESDNLTIKSKKFATYCWIISRMERVLCGFSVRDKNLETLFRQGFRPNSSKLSLDKAFTRIRRVGLNFLSCTEVWIIHPNEHYVLVYRSSREPECLHRSTFLLNGEEVAMFLSITVADLLQKLSFKQFCNALFTFNQSRLDFRMFRSF
jgi:hypothetical protein